MKKAIFCYSQTGNTELICRKIQKRVPGYEIIDIRKEKVTNLDDYDQIGIASFTYNLDLPPYFRDYISNFRKTDKLPAFMILSYSVMGGKAIRNGQKLLNEKGIYLYEYHSLKMPESFPPMRFKGVLNEDFPNEKDLKSFDEFLNRIENPDLNVIKKVKLGFWNAVISGPSQKKIDGEFGSLHVDKSRCSSCKICYDNCQYGAIRFEFHPDFIKEKCRSCYSCFNNCPESAIYTDSVGIDAKYSGPNKKLQDKFI